ncbi:hypothetical protein ACH4C2_24075 [Streptomyces sp. NPDC018057]|uniref:hypothetical protein n=1 Tax=unclassified Streptomyces TaxID=2593676 RepID=UPI00379C5D2E
MAEREDPAGLLPVEEDDSAGRANFHGKRLVATASLEGSIAGACPHADRGTLGAVRDDHGCARWSPAAQTMKSRTS